MNIHTLRDVLPALAALTILMAAGSAMAQKTDREATLKDATEAAERIRQATGATRPAVRVPPGDPCAILPLADVKKVFPGARSGERSKRLEEYGSTECAWKDAGGSLVIVVQESYSDGTALDDVSGMSIGFVDPLDPAARKAVRIERLTGIGDEAAAFIERADAKRGILSDGAMLSIRRGEHTLWLMSNQLSARDRTEALKALSDLGRAAAKRL